MTTGFLVWTVTFCCFVMKTPMLTHSWLLKNSALNNNYFHHESMRHHSLPVSSKSLFSTELSALSYDSSTTPPASKNTDDLLNYYLTNKQRDTFRTLDGINVVQLSDRERGVVYTEQEEVTSSSSSSLLCPGTELVFVSASEFITSSCGRKTQIGKALSNYLKKRHTEFQTHKPVLNGIYLAIYLCLVAFHDEFPSTSAAATATTTTTKQQQRNLDPGKYTTYLDTLPTIRDVKQHMPVFWSSNELNELQNSRVRDTIENRKRKWKDEYELICHAISLQQQTQDNKYDDNVTATETDNRDNLYGFVSFETYVWARSIVLSRTFASPSYGPCLVPFIDMLNHNGDDDTDIHTDSKTLCCDYYIDRSGFSLTVPLWLQQQTSTSLATPTATEDSLPTAYSLEISYGCMSNGELLLGYGFTILKDRVQDMKEIGFLTLDLDDTVNPAVRQLWNGISLNDNSNHDSDTSNSDHSDIGKVLVLRVGGTDGKDSTLYLLSMCRVATCHDNAEILNHVKDLHEDSAYLEGGIDTGTLTRQPISIENEIKAMKYLQNAVCNELAVYPTSLWEDEDLLLSIDQDSSTSRSSSTTAISENVRNAIVVRRGEKRVLHHFFNLACWALKLLDNGDDDSSTTSLEKYKQLLEEEISQNKLMYLTSTF